MSSLRGTYAEIDLDALEANFKAVARHFPAETFICPMIKADAYGHGAVEAGKALVKAGAKHLGVCLVEEGLELREAGITSDVLVFLEADRAGALELLRHRLTPVVTSMRSFDHLQAEASGPVDIHIKFDTGMNRLGFDVNEAAAVFERVKAGPFRVKGLATHLLNGQDADRDDGDSARQLLKLSEAAAVFSSFNPAVHALNSAGLLCRMNGAVSKPLASRNWGLRPGLMLYGAEPWPGAAGFLKPVMTLRSKVQRFRTIKRGESISYSATWRAGRDSTIAVIPIGYGDGYHRLLSNRGTVIIDGHRAPIVGTICMDYLMVDVTGLELKQNPDVVLFGRAGTAHDVSVAELAEQAQTIPWEIMTSIGRRVPRVYKGGSR